MYWRQIFCTCCWSSTYKDLIFQFFLTFLNFLLPLVHRKILSLQFIFYLFSSHCSYWDGSRWLVGRVLDLMIGFIALYAFTQFGIQTIQRYRWSTHIAGQRYTRTSVLNPHYSYPATGLSWSHCNFKSLVKSSWHSLIPFCHSAAAYSEDSTALDYLCILRPFFWLCPVTTPRHGFHGKHGLLLWIMRV
jgi:hypothetical protein